MTDFSSGSAVTADTLRLMKDAQRAPLPDELVKYFTQTGTATQGFQAYDLEEPSKKLIPVLTPLRNLTPRRTAGFGSQANWKAVTAINSTNTRGVVSEGNRGAAIQQVLTEYFAAYRGSGLENYVTYEADMASQGFEDLKALAVSQLLESEMIQEERMILGGNTSNALGTTPQPVASNAGTGGTIAAGTYDIICVALGPQAYMDLAGLNNGATGQSFDPTQVNASLGQLSKTNTDGSTDTFGGGAAKQSVASATTTTTGTTSTVTGTVAAVKGAWGYAWFIGTAGNERLYGITTINSIVMTSIPTAPNPLASAIVNAAGDNSTNALEFDGMFTIAAKTASSYFYTAANGTAGTGTGLTSDGAGGVAEFEAAFANFYNKYRLSPTKIFVSSQELLNLTKKIIGNSGAPLIRFNMDMNAVLNGQAMLNAGVVIGTYLNKIMGKSIPVIVHPNLSPGTILFITEMLPYPMNGIQDVFRMKLRRDYYQIEWPIKSRKYEYGVYFDGVFQHYAPFSMGVITNLGNV